MDANLQILPVHRYEMKKEEKRRHQKNLRNLAIYTVFNFLIQYSHRFWMPYLDYLKDVNMFKVISVCLNACFYVCIFCLIHNLILVFIEFWKFRYRFATFEFFLVNLHLNIVSCWILIRKYLTHNHYYYFSFLLCNNTPSFLCLW